MSSRETADKAEAIRASRLRRSGKSARQRLLLDPLISFSLGEEVGALVNSRARSRHAPSCG